jgi:hypothetical protein
MKHKHALMDKANMSGNFQKEISSMVDKDRMIPSFA